jgi:UDP-N-acetylmuramoyl-L-alanyl-D-glutamate--2,6-diaminopimelate ligase
MKLNTLLKDGEYRALCVHQNQEPANIEITRIVHDIRDITEGCLFICLRGSRTDSHLMLPYIKSRGAAAALVEENADFEMPLDFPCFEVPSTRRALAFAWSRSCGNPQEKLCMIGVTGTNGKTSTATMIEAALRAGGYRTALIGTVACIIDGQPFQAKDEDIAKRLTTMTTPDPDTLYPFLREAAEAGVTHVVMEVSSHALALQKVAPICFGEALFTNLSPEHLDFHSDMESYGKAKELLFKQCRHAIVNCDDPFGEALSRRLLCPHLSCGTAREWDVTADHIENLGCDGIQYSYRQGAIASHLHMQIPGAFTVYNSMLAAACAIRLGVPPTVAFHALESLKNVKGRMEIVSDEQDDISVYIDFAHTEAALRNLLKTAREFVKGNARLILVFGCGGDRDPTKRAPMGACAAELADFSIITSDNSRGEEPTSIISDILKGHSVPEKRKVIVDRTRAITFAIQNACPGDIILLAGKGHEEYEIKKGKILPFDERKIALDALKHRKEGHTNKREETTASCE